MHMDIGLIQSIWTVVVLIVFAGIVIWAWSDKNKTAFEEAAHLPIEDNDNPKESPHD